MRTAERARGSWMIRAALVVVVLDVAMMMLVVFGFLCGVL